MTEAVIRVGVIDDHPIVLHGLEKALHEQENLMITVTATDLGNFFDGQEALPDVVLLDLDLGDGSRPADNIRRLMEAGVSVLVFSAAAHPATVRAAIRAGAAGYITKTDALEDLMSAIRSARSGSGWVSPALAFIMLTDDAPSRPQLSTQEREVLRLYSTGLPVKVVAKRMDLSPETAKEYIARVRRKYRDAGRDARSKIDLRLRAVEDGIIPE
ncbi:response regulator transcription factor [Frankia nepalensis]|uniref:response regulator transcription factor n=1 Tax=Frankia nepalensis TaxID=1836974 RepID=UPI0027DCBB70|nr:response regulator transcription factor [Frankia nepalensis]